MMTMQGTTVKKHSLWGAHLYMPANNAGFIDSIPLTNAHNIVLDLEYATKYSQKTDARYLCKHAVRYIHEMRPDLNVAVRVNGPEFAYLCEQDIKEIASAQPDAIRVPAVNQASEVVHIDQHITQIEEALGFSYNSIKLHLMIESPQGLSHIREIAAASQRTTALCLGAEDWAHNLVQERKKPGKELEFIRNNIVAASAEFGLFPMDSVYPWHDDIDGLKADSLASRNLGMCARAVPNPKLVSIVDEIFKPSDDLIQWSHGILDNLQQVHLGEAETYVANDKIVEPLTLMQAERVAQYYRDEEVSHG